MLPAIVWCEKLIRGSLVSLNYVIKGVLFVLAFLGYEVDYVGDFTGLGLQPGNFIVRVLILLWTGNYPAQSEIGKLINGGIYPCEGTNWRVSYYKVLRVSQGTSTLIKESSK